MIQLKLRTEYSFRQVYGHIEKSVAACEGNAVGIADSGTWGFVKFGKVCKAQNKKPIYGVSIAVVESIADKRKRGWNFITMLAKNLDGLKEIYRLTAKANEKEQYYYVPRLTYDQLPSSENLIYLSGSTPDVDRIKNLRGLYLEASPNNKLWLRKIRNFALPVVAVSDVYYPYQSDRLAYEMIIGDSSKTGIQYIADEYMLKAEFDDLWKQSWFDNTKIIADQISEFDLPKAQNVKFSGKENIEALCLAGAARLKIDIHDSVYKNRLERELKLIHQKEFTDYFLVLADMITEAKKTMLVGPGRGSSAGSLVCYLLGITDVDPIPHGLIFERFIDINRADLPDIDVDFPDVKREQVIKYLQTKYGAEKVGHIGTISEYKPKSVLAEVAKSAGIPAWDIKDFKESVQERADGDSRSEMCIADALENTDLGKQILAKYPVMRVAGEIEGHARHTGVHAAGIVVLNDDLRNYCGITREGVAMLDKKDAEALNILKIDVLGLRTLSVIEDCLQQTGLSKACLLELNLNDAKVFETIFNKNRMSGIFQFEGYALKGLNGQMKVEHFDDIVALTTLARPGPLNSGGAGLFIKRRTGREAVQHLHPLVEDITKDTFGVIIYQEQIMAICRAVGRLSWEDVSEVRKAMGKSLGEEAFAPFWAKFWAGASAQGMKEADARGIWDTMREFGAYAFNKSHAVSYGIISYWCAWLKTYYPLEYAAACLKSNKDDEQTIQLLRELSQEGFKYVAFDKELSEVNWSIKKGLLVGGFLGIKGVGEKMAEDILARRAAGTEFTGRQIKLMASQEISYADVFEVQTKFKHFFEAPEKYKIESRGITYLREVKALGMYVCIAKLTEKTRRDMNEYSEMTKRQGKIIQENNLSLSLKFEDDTDQLYCNIDRWNYDKIGKQVFEEGQEGDIYIIKGRVKDERWRKINITKIKRIYSKDTGYVAGCEPPTEETKDGNEHTPND